MLPGKIAPREETMAPGPEDTNGDQASAGVAPGRASKHPKRIPKLNPGQAAEVAARHEPRRSDEPSAGQPGAPLLDAADRPTPPPFRYPVNRYARRP
jgi:hypothetical protein